MEAFIEFFENIPSHLTHESILWSDIIEIIEKRSTEYDQLLTEAIYFFKAVIGMRTGEEILVQDIAHTEEIKRLENFNVYRRDNISGIPLYFAPYFTANSGRQVGIQWIYEIIGVLKFDPTKTPDIETILSQWSSDPAEIKSWINGVAIKKQKGIHTHFFLREKFQFPKPLRKDSRKKKGTGKDWIAFMIPKNRRIGFLDILKHIPELK